MEEQTCSVSLSRTVLLTFRQLWVGFGLFKIKIRQNRFLDSNRGTEHAGQTTRFEKQGAVLIATSLLSNFVISI